VIVDPLRRGDLSSGLPIACRGYSAEGILRAVRVVSALRSFLDLPKILRRCGFPAASTGVARGGGALPAAALAALICVPTWRVVSGFARRLEAGVEEARMGLFDFAKEMGRKLFNREEEAAAKIQEHIEEENPGVENLQVEFVDGEVRLAGEAASAEAMEKAVLMAGNVRGVSNVSTVQLVAPEVSARVEYYVIQSGDTLGGIAKRFLGNAMKYPQIFEANREVIKDPNRIFPGQKIRIPLD
jgi:nucleoid-associated protein YgaU